MSLIILIIVILFGAFSSEVPVATEVMVDPVEVQDCGTVTETDGEASDGCIDPAETGAWEVVQIGAIEGVIAPEIDGWTFSWMFTDVDGYWTPSKAEIADAEDAIQHEQGGLEHTRQYVGFLEDGERKIFINGFCDAVGYDWEHEPVLVDDGGDCYFTAVYNVDSEGLEWFTFNGEA